MNFDISILMPSFNQGEYIEEAILSVLSQRMVRTQLIIMDGGSTDNTPNILRKYSNLIQFETEPDRGQSHALNKALVLAKAPIIGWLNSDDKYLPGSFRRALRAFSMNPDVSLVHGQRVLIDASSSVVGWSKSGPFESDKGHFNICSETAFWRTNCIPGHRFREQLRFAMDVHFLGTIARDREILYLQCFQGCFRCHNDSKSSTLWESYAVPESSSVWYELFSSAIGLTGDSNSKSFSSNLSNVRDLFTMPLAISSKYVMGRLRNKFWKCCS